MSFFSDLGKRITGNDDYTKSVTEMNNSQAQYLAGLADSDVVANEGDLNQQTASNSFLIISVVGIILVGGGITYFVTKK